MCSVHLLALRSDTTLLCDGLAGSRELFSCLFVSVSYLLSPPNRFLLSRVLELGRGVAWRGVARYGAVRRVEVRVESQLLGRSYSL